MQITKLFLLMSLFALGCGFSSARNPEVKKGDVVYSFESGKMQCLSQVNSEGNIVVLLKSLDKNTQVKFSKINRSGKNLVLVANMLVQEDPPICAGWVNMQEVKIILDPQSIENFTLFGKTIHKSDNITVMAEG